MPRALLPFGIRLLVCALLALPGTSSARWYDPGMGRFLSEDPLLTDVLRVREFLGSPMKLHPWLYANGNPTRYTDPDGREGVMEMPGDAVAWQCALWGDKLDFCRGTSAYLATIDETRDAANRGARAGAGLTMGAVSLGPAGLGLAWALGTTLDVAQQTYEDPTGPKTFDEVDFFSAAMNGAQMCALPGAIKGVQALGAGGKVLASGAMLYLSAHGLAEGAGQFAQGVEQGDAGRCTYGASMALLGVAGSQSVHGELSGLASNSRLPAWLHHNVRVEVSASGYVPGGPPPARVRLEPSKSRGKVREVFRELSPEDRANLEAGRGLIPKGEGGSIAEHIAGKSTGHISASLTSGATSRFSSKNGLVAIDVDKAIELGAKFIDHENVLQATAKNLKGRRDAKRAEEVLFRGPIPQEAIRMVR